MDISTKALKARYEGMTPYHKNLSLDTVKVIMKDAISNGGKLVVKRRGTKTYNTYKEAMRWVRRNGTDRKAIISAGQINIVDSSPLDATIHFS